jgi:hypothetical protein
MGYQRRVVERILEIARMLALLAHLHSRGNPTDAMFQ